jgi:hypothetical protein
MSTVRPHRNALVNAQEYEEATGHIADSVMRRVEELSLRTIQVGRQSKHVGASGFPHQIDVFIESESDVLLVECKHWRTRRVKVEHLLTFIGRVVDLRSSCAKTVHAVFVTSSAFQSGCITIERHFDVDLAVIASLDSFAFEYKGLRVLGVPAGSVELGGHAPAALVAPLGPPR